MKILKAVGISILIICSLLAVLILASSVYHSFQLKKEANLFSPPGKLVEVNNHKIHVYGEGSGNITLVFMSGAGTSYPTIDFKSLWLKMVDDYRIVVVEKAGYGWSEVSTTARDIETLLEETRTALERSGEKGPYVLVPHSMSGLEAIYWAQTYPNEVKAIIGLDPALPEVYESLRIP